MITCLEPDILECEVKWALESITMNKASGGDGIQLSYFKSWNTMLWKCCTQYNSKFGKLSSGHRTGKGQSSFQSQRNAMPKNAQTTSQLNSSHTLVMEKAMAPHSSTLAWKIPWMEEPGRLQSMGSWRVGHDWNDLAAATAHTSKEMFKILQARLQQYMNCELPEVQAGFTKGRGTRGQIANILWIIKKAREFQKNIYFCFIDYAKPLTMWVTINCGKFFKRWEYQTSWPTSWETYMQVRKQQLELDMEQQTGSK